MFLPVDGEFSCWKTCSLMLKVAALLLVFIEEIIDSFLNICWSLFTLIKVVVSSHYWIQLCTTKPLNDVANGDKNLKKKTAQPAWVSVEELLLKKYCCPVNNLRIYIPIISPRLRQKLRSHHSRSASDIFVYPSPNKNSKFLNLTKAFESNEPSETRFRSSVSTAALAPLLNDSDSVETPIYPFTIDLLTRTVKNYSGLLPEQVLFMPKARFPPLWPTPRIVRNSLRRSIIPAMSCDHIKCNSVDMMNYLLTRVTPDVCNEILMSKVQSKLDAGHDLGKDSQTENTHFSGYVIALRTLYARLFSRIMRLTSATISRGIGLVPVSRPKVLAIDLDETLICAVNVTKAAYTGSTVPNTSGAEILLRIPPTYYEAIPTLNGAEIYAVWERPDTQLFLSALSRLYSIVLFTSALPTYADALANRIECLSGATDRGPLLLSKESNQVIYNPYGARRICKRFYRDSCRVFISEGSTSQATPSFSAVSEGAHRRAARPAYAKDLSRIGVSLDSIILVDDREESFALFPQNGLLIEPFSPNLVHPGDSWPPKQDTALRALIAVLEALYYVPDVREVLKRRRVKIDKAGNA